MTIMKRSYVAPEAKVFAIGAEERIAVDCGESHFTQNEPGCNTLLTGGGGESNPSCWGGSYQNS